MGRNFVKSSNLRSVGYDSVSCVLEIEFMSGAVYQYFNVSSQTFDMLMSASSHGQFHNFHIKGKFRYRRVS